MEHLGLGSLAGLAADVVEHLGLDSRVGRTVDLTVRHNLGLLEELANR